MDEPVSTLAPQETAPERSSEPASVSGGRGAARFMARFHQPGQPSFAGRYALVGVWLVLAAVFAILEPNVFLSRGTFRPSSDPSRRWSSSAWRR